MPRPSLDEIFAAPAQPVAPQSVPARPSLDDIFKEPAPQPAPDGGSGLASLVRPDSSVPRTIFDKAYKGATFNFGDEIQALGGAMVASPVLAYEALKNGTPLKEANFGDLYNEGLKIARNNSAAQSEAHPYLSPAAEIAGSLGAGYGIAKTAAGANALNSLGSGGLGARVLKGAGAGAALSGVSGFGDGEGGMQNRFESGATSAAIGGAVGGVLPLAGAALGKAINAFKATPEKALTSDALKKEAAPFFKKFTESGASYSPQLTNEIADLADSSMSKGIAGATKPADEALNKSLEFYSSLRGKTLSPSDVQKLDQSFADDVARFNKAGEFNFGRILNNLKYEFRDRAFKPENAINYVTGGSPKAVEDLVSGNKLWAQSYKAKDVEKILQKAEGTENPQTSIRTGLKNLLANDKKMAAYSAEEKAILKDAMNRGALGGLIKLFGGRLTDSVAGGIAGMSAGGPVGAIAGSLAGKAVGGAMADAAGNIQANRLGNALAKIQAPALSAARPSMSTALVATKQPSALLGNTSQQLGKLLLAKQAGNLGR